MNQTSHQTGDKPTSAPGVTGIVLAAGTSSRWGDTGGVTAKQLALFRGQPLVRRAARTLTMSKVNDIVVVIGHQAQLVRAALAGIEVALLTNPDFRDGQSTSVRRGIRGVDPEHQAAIITPCDQPLLNAELIDTLIDTFVATGASAVVPHAQGRRGAPALIARSLFPSLEALEGDTGARRILAALGDQLVSVPVTSPLPLRDVDTPADLARIDTLANDPDISHYS